jgi:hypothetical protein
MRAAMQALETGDAGHILIWIPADSENTLRNILEKACCDRTIHTKAHSVVTDWYFLTVSRLHSRCYGPQDLNISTKTPDEKKIIRLAERTFQSGNFSEMTREIPDTPDGKIQRQFRIVMRMKDFDPNDTAAGRAWVSAFTDFIALVNHVRSGTR